MKRLTPEQFKEYTANPLAADEKVRKWAGVPDNRYYSVAVWPEENAGSVRLTHVSRTVAAKKISKSDQ
jgi:hypothetical protein